LIALGSGGILGKGLGMGVCKYGHLPEDTTDFIFAIIGEELGFVGTAGVILLFIAFVWLGVIVIVRCREPFGQLLASGIVLAISFQAVLNIAVVTVVVPTKGIPLPFVSAGGTSLLLSAAAVGVLINIAKHLPARGDEG
jgi:cell division protein FtsW